MKNPLSPIVQLARRIRLQLAESDLAFLEARAPHAIEAQRSLVDRLRAANGLPPMRHSSDTIVRSIERTDKLRRLGLL